MHTFKKGCLFFQYILNSKYKFTEFYLMYYCNNLRIFILYTCFPYKLKFDFKTTFSKTKLGSNSHCIQYEAQYYNNCQCKKKVRY